MLRPGQAGRASRHAVFRLAVQPEYLDWAIGCCAGLLVDDSDLSSVVTVEIGGQTDRGVGCSRPTIGGFDPRPDQYFFTFYIAASKTMITVKNLKTLCTIRFRHKNKISARFRSADAIWAGLRKNILPKQGSSLNK